MCRLQKIVTVGDPATAVEITRSGPVRDDPLMITETEAWTSVGLAALGALLVWADTGKPIVILVPILMLFFFQYEADNK